MLEKFEYSIQTVINILKERNDYAISGNFSSITNSSLDVVNGSLFIPLIGNRDGHEFIRQALENGATGFIYEKKNKFFEALTENEKRQGIEVKNTLTALGTLAAFHRSRFKPFIICITGSSGKTTTKEILGKCVEYLGLENIVVTEKNYNNEIGLPFTLFRINEKTRVCVLELGMNHRYEISRMVRMAVPGAVFITNVGPCHIENLGSLKEIARAKSEIIEGNENIKVFIPEDIVYKNIFIDKAKKYNNKIIEFSLKDNEFLKVSDKSPRGYELEVFGEKVDWKLPVPRVLENLAGVIDVLRTFSFEKGGIISGLNQFQASNKRNELIDKGILIIDDTYNANPDSMKSSIESLLQISENRKAIAILGDMKELGEFSKRFHKEVGFYAGKKSLSILISFGKDAYYISNEYKKESKGEAFHFLDEPKSIEQITEIVLKNLSKGDVVLIKGSRSMKMERIVENLKNRLDGAQ